MRRQLAVSQRPVNGADLGSEDAEAPARARASAPPQRQGRQDSNLQPPVLETGALPIAPRPWARTIVSAQFGHHRLVSTIEEPRPDDDLLEEQEGQGYGEDEGERDDALDAEDAQ